MYLKLKNELKKKQQDLTQLNCLLDTLSSENEDLHLQLQETQNEITEIKSGIENLKKSIMFFLGNTTGRNSGINAEFFCQRSS